MIGIVVVSHSPALAEAAVALALEMVPGTKPPIVIAAGAGDGIIGTDATRISSAIEHVASPDGVLVIMDLGSALLSAELAVELLPDPELRVKLTSAPFVEGLLAAVVRAAGGATLDEVDREARGALAAKVAQLGEQEPEPEDEPRGVGAAQQVVELELSNPSGLHARPAALFAAEVAKFDATVTVENLRTASKPMRGDSTIALLTLGTRRGDFIRVAAEGPQAAEALAAISSLVHDGFGE